MSEKQIGFKSGEEFRISNGYTETLRKLAMTGMSLEKLIEKGLPENLEDNTPPAVFNIIHIFRQQKFLQEIEKFKGRKLNVAVTGVSTEEGTVFLNEALKLKGYNPHNNFIIDVDKSILDQISKANIPNFHCIHADARNTGLENQSQDIVFKDHLGNCCPPGINKDTFPEISRILKPDGIAIINITTSDLLPLSKNRKIISQQQLSQFIGSEAIETLKSSIYDLHSLKQNFPNIDINNLKSSILEIAPESFVAFSDDPQAHCEWFQSLNSHLNSWFNNEFSIIDMKSRHGTDNHQPPLLCQRHNVILRKNV